LTFFAFPICIPFISFPCLITLEEFKQYIE
jgi:hypothetical protein